MLNKWRLNFVLSALGHLKRSCAGGRIQNFSCMHRNVPDRSERSSIVGHLLTPHDAVAKTCVRHLRGLRRPRYLSDKETKVNLGNESNTDDSDTSGEESERSDTESERSDTESERSDSDMSDFEDGRREWGCETVDESDNYGHVGWPPDTDHFDKAYPNSNGFIGDMFKVISYGLRRHLNEMEIDQFHYFQSLAAEKLNENRNYLLNARTGYGKTLVYSICLVNKLLETTGKEPGRPPRLVILAPSAEVTSEILDVVELVANKKLTVGCIHDGIHYSVQKSKILAGVDILIGTPNSLQNLYRNGILSLCDLRHVVFDGFDHRMDYPTFPDFIYQDRIGAEGRKIHTVVALCQGETPSWVDHLRRKHLPYIPPLQCGTATYKQAKMVENNIYNWFPLLEHRSQKYAYECHLSYRDAMVASLIQLNDGQTIIFGQTKEDIDRLVLNGIIGEQLVVIHPDMPHDVKKKILKKFKDGHLKCLATTEVSPHAAEYPLVKLVIHLGLDMRSVNYVCRSNQATDQGSSVILYEPSEHDFVKFRVCDIVENYYVDDFRLWKIYPEDDPEHLAAMIKISARSVLGVSESAATRFVEAARRLIAQHGPVSAISSALSVIAGHVTHDEESEALREEICHQNLTRASEVEEAFRRQYYYEEEKQEEVNKLTASPSTFILVDDHLLEQIPDKSGGKSTAWMRNLR